MAYQGDYVLAALVDFKFCTVDSTGAPTVLSGTPAISVYKSNDTTQTTTGVTLSVDFDGVVGLNHVHIDTSNAFYATGTDFDVVITTGTVDSISVVGYTVGSFSINNRSALRPTTIGRTLDVAATGEAGLDFDNVKAASAPTTLTNITVPAVTTVTTVSGNVTGSVGSVVGNVGGNVVGSVASVTAGVVVTTNNDKTGYSLTTGQFQVKKNTALANFTFPMFSSTTHQMVTGKTVTAVITIDGAAPVTPTNTVSEVGSGFYKINWAAADLNGNTIGVKFSATACDDLPFTFITQA